MAESSEAECLLRTGALYTKRIGLRQPDGQLIFVGVKRGAFSIYVADEPIYHFDLDGRWQRAYLDGDHYRKSLDQSVDLIGRIREGANLTLDRARRTRAEIDALDDKIRNVALDLSIAVSSGALTVIDPQGPDLAMTVAEFHDLMDRVGAWDAPAWFARREQFVAIYGQHTPFVPLDSQNPILLDPVDPASGEIRDAVQFAAYCRRVAKFLGRRAIQASTLYLVGDPAVRRPVDEILGDLASASEVFPMRSDSRPARPQDLPQDRPSLMGVELLVESSHGVEGLPDAEGWRRLAEARVRRVTVIAGSGGDPGRLITDIKAGGIAVSLLLAYGAGDGSELEALSEGVNRAPLGKGDFVYLGDSRSLPSFDEQPLSSLTTEQREAQKVALEAALTPTRARGVRVLDYNPAKQWA